MKGLTKSCDVDTRFEIIDGMGNTEVEFYDANGNFDSTLSAAPKSSQLLNTSVNIEFYSRKYVYITSDCR
jgi:hypothetical protein